MSHAPFDLSIVNEVDEQLVQAPSGEPGKSDPKAIEKRLKAFLKISQGLAAARAVEEILPQLLHTLMSDIFPFAQRGSILLLDPQTGTMIPTAQQHRTGSESATVQLSRTVLDLVLEEKQAERSSNAGQDARFKNSASLALMEVHSMVCVPMLTQDGEAIGIIHIDSHSAYASFTDDDMALLMAIAGQAAQSYDSARQMLKREQIRSEMEIARHRALSQMVSGLAHELNTPLGIINSSASLIADSLKDDSLKKAAADEAATERLQDAADAAELLQNNLRRANQLITEFKKLSARQLADSRESGSLGELLEELALVAGSQAHCRGKAIALSNHIAGQDGWDGFPGHMSQVVLSLLDNAAHHAYPNQEGKIEVHLYQAALEGAPAYMIQVRDYGAGIAPEHLGQVSVPFFTTARHRGHRGLGLAIAHAIVHDSLRGTVQVQSAPGDGTAVTVTVPVRVPDPGA